MRWIAATLLLAAACGGDILPHYAYPNLRTVAEPQEADESNDSKLSATWVSDLHAGEQVFIHGVAGAGDRDYWKMEFLTDSTVWFVWGGGHVQILHNGVNLGRYPVCDWVNSPLNVSQGWRCGPRTIPVHVSAGDEIVVRFDVEGTTALPYVLGVESHKPGFRRINQYGKGGGYYE